MYPIVKWLHLMALVVWLGEVVCFSFVVAPSIFRTFEVGEAGRAVGAIFPLYYRIGYVCGAVLLVTSMLFLATGTSRLGWSTSSGLAAVMLVATLYAGVVIQPRAAALRPQLHAATAAPGTKEEFDRLHRLAVTLNGAVLICGLVVSVISATRLQP